VSSWSPAEGEPNPFLAAILTQARNLLAPDSVAPVGAANAEGWTSFVLPDGRRGAVAIDKRVRPERRWGPRASIAYDLVGRATLEKEGFVVRGAATIDAATRAFLELEVELAQVTNAGA
jgi:hypothetical protein